MVIVLPQVGQCPSCPAMASVAWSREEQYPQAKPYRRPPVATPLIAAAPNAALPVNPFEPAARNPPAPSDRPNPAPAGVAGSRAVYADDVGSPSRPAPFDELPARAVDVPAGVGTVSTDLHLLHRTRTPACVWGADSFAWHCGHSNTRHYAES